VSEDTLPQISGPGLDPDCPICRLLPYDACAFHRRSPRGSASWVPYLDAPELVGRRFRAADGVRVVLEPAPPRGMYYVRRPGGSEQPMLPSIIQAALRRDEVPGAKASS
jgi:hypothetical protein